MSKLVFSVTKIVSQKHEEATPFDLLQLTFAETYAHLRAACPRGDLRIHLSVEVDKAEDAGAVVEPHDVAN